MNIQDFIKLVREMRRAQLDYYRDRTYGKLVAAKDLERQVDSALRASVELGTSAPAQPTVVQTSFMEASNEKQDQ